MICVHVCVCLCVHPQGHNNNLCETNTVEPVHYGYLWVNQQLSRHPDFPGQLIKHKASFGTIYTHIGKCLDYAGILISECPGLKISL